jgi:transcriptional regulator with XRE-family HTH domain
MTPGSSTSAAGRARGPAWRSSGGPLGQNVKSARKSLALSQEALALEAEIDRTYISGIERGLRNPSLDLIVRLAKSLKTTPAALLMSAKEGRQRGR